MTTILQPRTTANLVGANQPVQNTEQKVLFVGQQTSAGSATSGALTENVLNNAEDSLYGANSMLAGMIRSARNQNPVTRFDAIGLDDGGGATQATLVVTFTGAATENGTITIAVGSEIDYSFDVGIANGDTATDIGTALETLINADSNVLVIASNAAGVVTLTAVNGGTIGNFIGLSFSGAVAGVTVALTAATGGATDPVLTGVFDVVGNNRYQGIVWPYFADTSEVRSFLDARFNVDNRVLDGVAITSSVDTLSNHLSRLNPLNSQSLIDIADKAITETAFVAPAQFELIQVKAAQFAAIRALRLTEGANIGQFVLSQNGPADATGGAALASKPYFNTPFPDLPLIVTGRGWTDTEIEQLVDAGGTSLGTNAANNGAIIGEVVTTYKTDAAANPDISFKFLNYVDTSSGIREYYFNNLRSRFAQSRLTEGDVIFGRDMANALTIRAFCERLYLDLSGPNFVLVEAGAEARRFYKENLIITIDKAEGLVIIFMVVPIVTQLRTINATIRIAFSTQA